jgi:hypothetical protein
MTGQTLTLRITLVAPPAGVLYALQDGEEPVGHVMADGGDLSLDVSVRFVEDDKGVRYLGPFVKNQGGRRFVYFRVGASAGQHGSPWTRRGKVWLEDIPLDLARAAAASGGVVAASFPGAGKDGSPSCATVRPIAGWRLAG